RWAPPRGGAWFRSPPVSLFGCLVDQNRPASTSVCTSVWTVVSWLSCVELSVCTELSLWLSCVLLSVCTELSSWWLASTLPPTLPPWVSTEVTSPPPVFVVVVCVGEM